MELVRVRCRLLGYWDDDDTEEIKEYNLMRESDGAIIYLNDVHFDESAEIPPLLDSGYSYSEELSNIFSLFLQEAPYQQEVDISHHGESEQDSQSDMFRF